MRTVAVGTVKGLFVLEQLGPDPVSADWELGGPYRSGGESTTVAIEEREGRLELLAELSSYVYGPHVRRSLDEGESWEPVGSGPGFTTGNGRPTVERIWTLHRLAGSGDLVAGVAQAGLLCWDDRALTWREYVSLTIHPSRLAGCRVSPGCTSIPCSRTVASRAGSRWGSPRRTPCGATTTGPPRTSRTRASPPPSRRRSPCTRS